MRLAKITKQIVSETLKQNNFNRTKTAKQLGISIRTLRIYIHDWKLTGDELVKKKAKQKPTSELSLAKTTTKTCPTLAHIVLSNGSRVDIPKLPFNFSQLTSYENIRCALEVAATMICSTNQAEKSYRLIRMKSGLTPLDCLRLQLEDLLNHLHYAIQDYPKKRGSF